MLNEEVMLTACVPMCYFCNWWYYNCPLL